VIARRIFTHPLLWTAIVFAVLPFVAGANPFVGKGGFVDIATTMLVFALFASGFNLLLGHLGELSFGHAMFFATGAYVTALSVHGFTMTIGGFTWTHAADNTVFAALFLSLAFVLVWAIILARLIVPRSSGVYYSMITLAFAQVIFFIAFKVERRHARRRRHPRDPAPHLAGALARLPQRFVPFLRVRGDRRVSRALRDVLAHYLAVRQRAARDSGEQDPGPLSRLRRQ
jgi:branched-subunit amino acid ABC-type transport system permease component